MNETLQGILGPGDEEEEDDEEEEEEEEEEMEEQEQSRLVHKKAQETVKECRELLRSGRGEQVLDCSWVTPHSVQPETMV